MNIAADRLPLRAWLAIALGAVLLSLVAWRVLTLGMADHLAKPSPRAALAWRATHSEAQLRQGGLRPRNQDDRASEVASAKAAIRAAPLDGRGYRQLAEARGDDQAVVAALYSLAATRGPRDLPSLGWLIRYSLARGDYAEALAHIDQVLRVEPELAPRLFPVLMALAGQEKAELARILLRDPPWRSSFVLQFIEQSPDSKVVSGLVERLRRSPSGISETELSAWLDRLVRDRQWGNAYLYWVESLAPEGRRRIGNVYNGSFELEPSHLGFDWRFGRVPGARVSRAQVSGAEGRYALRIDFEDRRVAFQHVRQLLALVPGAYRLQGRVRLDDLRGERGLVWTLTCAEDGRPIAETDPQTGRHGWRGFVVEVEVPPVDCGGQWLTLRVPARIPAENRLGGVAWFDDLQIRSSARPQPGAALFEPQVTGRVDGARQGR